MTKKIGKMTYDNFTIYGEVQERLPLYTDNLDTVYPLNKSSKTIFDDCEIKVNDNTVTTVHGNSSMIINKNNVSINNNYMSFDGNSEIQLDKELLNSTGFEIEIKFKVTDITDSLMNLLVCKYNSESTLSLILDCPHRYIYANIKGDMYSASDLDLENTYSLTDSGAINKDIWYTLKFIKKGSIAAVYLNHVLTKTLIFKEDFICDYISIGQGLKGLVEYIRITKDTEDFEENIYSITNDNLLNSFTANFYWTPDPIGNYNIMKIDSFNIVSLSNTLSISLDNVEIASVPVFEENTYYISLAYNKEERQAYIYVYNQTTHALLLNINKAININTNTINIINDPSVYDLAIYKTYLEKRFILRNVQKNFSINKYGDIQFNIDEVNTGFRLGDSFYLPMSYDLDSVCKTITNKEEVYVVDKSIKSGLYEADDILELIDLDVLTLTSANWDNNLHHKAYKISNWDNGYNSEVINPTIGYHAKWTLEHSSPDTMQLKFINCNSDYGLTNRILTSSRDISVNELWNKCKVGDKISIIFKARADMPCEIRLGIYRTLKSTGTNNFKESLKDVKIESPYWTEYYYETTIDEDWDLTKAAKLHFYGHLTDKSTSCIKEVYLIRNGNKAPIDAIQDRTNRVISIPFKNQIELTSPNLSIIYNTKLISNNNEVINNIGDIYWGLKDKELFIRQGDKESEVFIDKVQTDEWITLGVIITSSNIIVYLSTRQGIYTCNLNNLSLTAINIGNIEFDSSNCSLYKDLFISKDIITKEKFEAYHRTKMSYFKNFLILKNDIEESNI